jgi:hypothetical protein
MWKQSEISAREQRGLKARVKNDAQEVVFEQFDY